MSVTYASSRPGYPESFLSGGRYTNGPSQPVRSSFPYGPYRSYLSLTHYVSTAARPRSIFDLETLGLPSHHHDFNIPELEGSQICPILECLPTSQFINVGESNDIMISESFRVPEKVSPDRDHQNCLNWGLPSHMIA
jgi:hypothetical protein